MPVACVTLAVMSRPWTLVLPGRFVGMTKKRTYVEKVTARKTTTAHASLFTTYGSTAVNTLTAHRRFGKRCRRTNGQSPHVLTPAPQAAP